jgi:hypothetical protein
MAVFLDNVGSPYLLCKSIISPITGIEKLA